MNVGWYGYTGTFQQVEIPATLTSGVYGVSAASAGANFPAFYLAATATAYFVTGTMTAVDGEPMAGNPGVFQLNLWSYPVFQFDQLTL